MEASVQSPSRLAVIGSGVSGLTAAYIASRSAHVTLYEADQRLGGHADTHRVLEGDTELAIDTGFIVHNRRTYPVLCRLFDELGVETQEAEMSMSITDEGTGIQWCGARGLKGLFPEWSQVFDRRFLAMLIAIPRFHRQAKRLLEQSGGHEQTLNEFLADGGFNDYFRRHFAEPLVAAVWSCDPETAGQYPARYLFQFLSHHGMLSIWGSPAWRTVVGGSIEYVERIAKHIEQIRLNSAVISVREADGGVIVTDVHGHTELFDHVVIATHPHQALAMLGAEHPAATEVLGDMGYSDNPAILHMDASLLPDNDSAWGSWNFRRQQGGDSPLVVTYDLTRLQRLDTQTRYLVTLGGRDLIDPATIIDERPYEHPIYTPRSLQAQRQLAQVETPRIALAGAYHGWGFHEDGARSGLQAVERLGFTWVGPQALERRTYATTVKHVRQDPMRRAFTHQSRMWLVDIDRLPKRSKVKEFFTGSIRAQDHLGEPQNTLRENLQHFLAHEGIELADARVHLATQPRAFGFCFNPISVWWCTRRDGTPLATVIEVHNTYGDRHAYVVHPDDVHRATVDKEMYVSPFHGTDGHYDVYVPPPGDSLNIGITLHHAGGQPFAASLTGSVVDEGPLRSAASSFLDAVRIRMHGLVLWARRLPIQPRPLHHQKGVR